MEKRANHKKTRNIKLVMQYDGSAYGGWQRLGSTSGKPGIQKVLEETISECLKEDINVIGSGRTDTGVHALGQTANFHCSSTMSLDCMKSLINTNLPEDIKIIIMETASIDFHSRYSARSKTYKYFIDSEEVPSVFTRKYALHVPEVLNFEAMKKGASYLIGTHDFKAFCTDRKDGKSTVRTIEAIEINRTDRSIKYAEGYFCIAITGDGFLHHMIRIIVGTLLEVGKGMRAPEEIEKILKSRRRDKAGVTVYPNGLFLTKVRY
ncbi:tRNA pseudouridine synthase A [Anaerocolumna cellulosilytica]|uniref:tRNA pseudouridine synthase A n=1 Tax=Anaerocolumna cellulosilytica TaxID=433286 RepID=A0A6S6QSM8_9FIRM|nr:tRNA pseudouridine(38-40) synthase TruA [Anaerocolumna cellulosilytica]MBB5196966.1 tRNA pseudouridine38-40 synthase [Anaerocolumna cellulosilytica]BCJ92636.1 tRNA pseudouridine synthase A [Anaerocolumna cellulosilytica]